MNPTISVVIPVYNEGAYILNEISVLRESRGITEIIVVNDKSKPEFTEMYRKIEGIRLIEHEVNKGKSGAVKTGIDAATTDYVMVLDGDLVHLTKNHIEQAISYAKDYEVIYLIRQADTLIAKILGATYLTVGEHILGKKFIKTYYNDLFDKTRWGFDNKINYIVTDNKIPVKYLNLQGLEHQLKSLKYSFIDGLVSDIKMFYEVVIKGYRFVHFFRLRIALNKYIKAITFIKA